MKTKSIFQAASLVLLVVSLMITGCAPQASQPAAPTETPMLTGKVNRADLQTAPGWETLDAADYTPDASLVKAVRDEAGDVQILLFLGTWCGDSKREVPRFFKLMDQVGIAESQVEIIALDRTKKDADGMTEKLQVQYVPTFIFIRDGKEIGRIVEYPQDSLEADLAAILSKG